MYECSNEAANYDEAVAAPKANVQERMIEIHKKKDQMSSEQITSYINCEGSSFLFRIFVLNETDGQSGSSIPWCATSNAESVQQL